MLYNYQPPQKMLFNMNYQGFGQLQQVQPQMQMQQISQLYSQQGQPQPQGQSSMFMQQPQGQSSMFMQQNSSHLMAQQQPQGQSSLFMQQPQGQNVSAPLQTQIPTQVRPKKVQSNNVVVGHPPAPGPAPVLQQAQGSPSKISKVTQVTEDDDDSKQQQEGGDDEEGSDELPCTINTFGFGASHNAQLMKDLAENGRGMYAFIENTDQIADTFAECLGGLVSVVGQNLKVQVQALNNVEINRCLVKGYPVNVDIPRKKHTISVKDVQSEESRDFVFELKVPQIEAEKKEDPLIQLSVNYDNVVRGSTETLTNVCNITRIEGKQIGERNLELDLQYNRVLAANAMEEANKLAARGKLHDARRVLTTAQEHIKKSKTNQDEFCMALVKDMQTCQSNMVDHSAYRSRGAKMMGCGARSHMRQRAAQPSKSSQQAYRGFTRGRMVSKAKASS